MEYIPGPTLSQLRTAAAKAGRHIPLAICAQIGLEAALGLDHAHGAKDLRGGRLGVVHRDVSPQNIMVRVDGVTKVVDFGIARASNRASRTATGLVKGKIAYMPPEQLTGRDLDVRRARVLHYVAPQLSREHRSPHAVHRRRLDPLLQLFLVQLGPLRVRRGYLSSPALRRARPSTPF